MPQYRFIVEGDFVKFYDGTQHVMTLRNTAQDIDWYYNTSPGLAFELNGLPYKVENANEIEIDGVTLSANTEFDAAVIAIFPNLAGGGEGGGITTVGNVGAGDAKGAAITGSSIFMHKATETQPGLVSVDVTPQVFGGPKSFAGTAQFQNLATFESIQKIILSAPPGTPPAGYGYLYAKADKKLYFKNADDVEFLVAIGGIDDVLAKGQALTADRTLNLNGHVYEFDGGGFYIDLQGNNLAYIQNGEANYLIYASPTSAFIRGADPTAAGNEGQVTADADDEMGRFVCLARFNGGAEEVKITGTAENGVTKLSHEADTHRFQTISEFADNAAALVGGLTDGMIYRTADVLKIVHE